MKVTFITEYDSIGGGERNLVATAVEFAKTHDVSVLCPEGALSSTLRNQNIRTYPVKIGKRWLSLFPCPSLLFDHPALHTADIIHAYSINSLPLCARYRKKVVLTLHGFWEKPRLREIFIRFLAARMTAVSGSVGSLLRIHDERIQVVPLGQNFPSLPLVSKTHAHQAPFKILCLGRFQEIKGQDLLVTALHKLRKLESCAIELLFVGSPSSPEDQPYYDSVVQKVASENWGNHAISFLPFQKDVFPLLKDAHLTVVPSRYESFSMVTIESLWSGTPVVVPTTGGAKEIINSAKIGKIFTSSDADSLAIAIHESIAKYSDFSSEECRARAAHFSIEKQCQNLLKIYTAVIGK